MHKEDSRLPVVNAGNFCHSRGSMTCAICHLHSKATLKYDAEYIRWGHQKLELGQSLCCAEVATILVHTIVYIKPKSM